MKHLRSDICIIDAGNHRVNNSGTFDLSAEVRSQVAVIKLYLVDKLGANFIFGCGLCEKHVEANCPRRRLVELADVITVFIIR